MRTPLYFFLLLLVSTFIGCQSEKKPEDVAALTAKAYYEQLLEGKYDQFVDGHYQTDSIPASYREQLIANAKMFIGQQKDDHRGILQVRIVDAKTDTTHHVSNVYLALSYGDSTTEEIVVPMVYVKGVWYMK
ncbi:MAG: hypothetical protein ACOYJF_01460 [Prevotella sp.]|jgi:hypothetical protein